MVSGQPVLLILAADRRELSGFGALRPAPNAPMRRVFEIDLPGGPAVLAAGGTGREKARRAVERLSDDFPVSAVVSVGYVGALDPALAIGDIFLPRRVTIPQPPAQQPPQQAMQQAMEYPVTLPYAVKNGVAVAESGVAVAVGGTLITIDRVAQTAAEKARLHAAGADAVDMEAAAVAAVAARRGLEFFCVRAVSDTAQTDFPVDFNRARRSDGTFSGWNIAVQAGCSPQRWRRLFQLQRDAETASRSLARFLRQCRFPLS